MVRRQRLGVGFRLADLQRDVVRPTAGPVVVGRIPDRRDLVVAEPGVSQRRADRFSPQEARDLVDERRAGCRERLGQLSEELGLELPVVAAARTVKSRGSFSMRSITWRIEPMGSPLVRI